MLASRFLKHQLAVILYTKKIYESTRAYNYWLVICSGLTVNDAVKLAIDSEYVLGQVHNIAAPNRQTATTKSSTLIGGMLEGLH